MQVTDLNVLSLKPPASFPELYQELWWYSGSDSSVASTLTSYLMKGTTNNTTSASSAYSFTLSSNWSQSTKYALEAAVWVTNGYTATMGLYDVTAGSMVSGSQTSTTSTTATVLRSGQLTLIPGHKYAVAIWSSSTSGTAYITDASLIIFPPAGSVSPSLSSISLANPSGGSLKEAYIPLWVWSSSNAADANALSAGSSFLQKGNQQISTSSTSPSVKLHTLNSNWSPSQKFAFESSLYGSSSYASYAALWDFTAGAIVSGSQVSVTSSTFTLVRSGSFTLTPSHSYGITCWKANSSGYCFITKAHLVALGG